MLLFAPLVLPANMRLRLLTLRKNVPRALSAHIGARYPTVLNLANGVFQANIRPMRVLLLVPGVPEDHFLRLLVPLFVPSVLQAHFRAM